ncbi:hypothetical protein [Haloplanus halobius]|uniref:hypothetical protein n=1 Tax=Haloplanus halobius TaxID=2934938 RepID=UPI00200C56E8|nr:hypothetical protein [Haloplanus sp. XH21]
MITWLCFFDENHVSWANPSQAVPFLTDIFDFDFSDITVFNRGFTKRLLMLSRLPRGPFLGSWTGRIRFLRFGCWSREYPDFVGLTFIYGANIQFLFWYFNYVRAVTALYATIEQTQQRIQILHLSYLSMPTKWAKRLEDNPLQVRD